MDAEGERLVEELKVRGARSREKDRNISKAIGALGRQQRGKLEKSIASQAAKGPVGAPSALMSRNAILQDLPYQLKQIKLDRIGSQQVDRQAATLAIKESQIKQQALYLEAVTDPKFALMAHIL